MRKISDERRAALLHEVRQTGNQTLAAMRAGVSRSWVTLTRTNDAAFDRAVVRAIESARRRLGKLAMSAGRAGGEEPEGRCGAAEWRTRNGTVLVLRGIGDGRTQVARARSHAWDVAAERRFLATLAACCDVKRACRAAGLSVQSAYARRRRLPAFAAAWAEAAEAGEMTLEATLLAAAMRVVEAHPAPPPPPADDDALVGPPMTIEQVFQVLGLREARRRGPRRPYGPRLKMVSVAELNASILKKLDVLEQREQAKRARRKAAEAGR